MPTEPPLDSARRHRRTDWRGERRPVLVRLPEPVAEQLCQAALSGRRSVSETAADLLTAALAENLA